MKARSRTRLVAVAALGVVLFAAAPAKADHHFSLIREVFPGVTADPLPEFVEVQMYAAGQNVLSGQGQLLRFYGADGSILHVAGMSNVANGQSQRTWLLGSPNMNALFGVTPDFPTGGSNLINSAGGAVCFASTTWGDIDCVSWGTFNNTPGIPVGSNETGPIPNGYSIERSIAAGNPSLLDAADDSGDSQADFSPLATPTPCPNAAQQTPTACQFPSPTPPSSTSPATPNPGKKCKQKGKKKGKAALAAKKKCKKKKKKKK